MTICVFAVDKTSTFIIRRAVCRRSGAGGGNKSSLAPKIASRLYKARYKYKYDVDKCK